MADEPLDLLPGTRKAKHYWLTSAGRRRLNNADKWNRIAEVIAGIMQVEPEEI